MSRSKHVIQDVPPKPRRHILRREPIILLAKVAGYFMLTVALRLGLGALLRALFAAWNVNARTVARAPGWAQVLYAWQGSIITLIVDVAALAFLVFICKVKLPRPAPKRDLPHWAVGTALALVSATIFLLTDSLRLMWPLSQPHLTFGLLPLCGLTLLTALSEEAFTKGLVYDGIKSHGRIWAILAATLLFFLTGGGYSGTWISGVNVALMGLLCAILYDRFGLWAAALFRWGWGFATVFLLGQVYRLYGVSETLLTGGDAGLVYGLWLTAVLIFLTGITMRRPR